MGKDLQSPEPLYAFSKPPRAPTSSIANKPKTKDANKMMRIQEEEYFEEDEPNMNSNTNDEFQYSSELEMLNHGTFYSTKLTFTIINKI